MTDHVFFGSSCPGNKDPKQWHKEWGHTRNGVRSCNHALSGYDRFQDLTLSLSKAFATLERGSEMKIRLPRK